MMISVRLWTGYFGRRRKQSGKIESAKACRMTERMRKKRMKSGEVTGRLQTQAAEAGKKHLVFLDVLRTFAFACIILYHFMIELEISNLYSFPDHGISYANANMHIATLGVSLFFIVSGAGLMLSARRRFDLKTYYKKRMTRILIPFYLVYFGYLCWRFITEKRLPYVEGIPAWRFVFTLAGMDEYMSLFGATFSLGIGEWFLGCLVLMYLLFPLLRWCMEKNSRITMLAATIYYVVLILVYPFQTPVHMNFFVKIYEFLLGMYLITRWNRIDRRVLWFSIPVVLIFVFCPVGIPIPNGFRITLLSLAVFLLVIPFESFLSKRTRLIAVLKKVSTYSFEIYLVHHVVLQGWNKWFSDVYFRKQELLLLFLLDLIVMILLGVLVKQIEEKIIARLK